MGIIVFMIFAILMAASLSENKPHWTIAFAIMAGCALIATMLESKR